jgi:carbonic anhydrase
MHNKIFLLFLFFLSIICSIVQADMRPQLKNRVGIPPFQVLKEIIDTNYTIKHKTGHSQGNNSPYFTWLTDADPRIYSRLITSSKNIYEVRNLGNQLSSSLATIDYGIRHLHTPLLLITGNSDSDAIRLFNEGYNNLEQSIRLDLDHLHIPLDDETADIVEKETKQDKEMRLVEANVDYQVALASKRYSQRIKAGRLVVVGSVLDLDNHYGSGKNTLRIINVNGEKDRAKLKKNRLFRQLPPEMLKMVGR